MKKTFFYFVSCKFQHLLIIVLLALSISKSNAQSIAGGSFHSLILPTNNSVPTSCGANNKGQLGDGTTNDKNTLGIVNGITNIIQVAAKDSNSLFLKNDGTVWACGVNTYGQLGDGTTTNRSTPVQVSGLSGIIAIAAGATHSLFLKSDGTVWACGYNFSGQFGNGTNTSSNTPVQVSALTGITAIAVGNFHSLFLKNDGTVWACGVNSYGQLGDSTNTQRNSPVQVSGLTGITGIAAGQNHSLFLKSDGTAWACGYNIFGQLGDGTGAPRKTPVQVSGLTGITAIAAGGVHSLFLKNDGTAWACGYNFWGQLGNGSNTFINSTALQVSGLTGITTIAGGGVHSLFLKSDGTAWACGYNNYGQLGDGTYIDKSTPVLMTLPCTAPTSPSITGTTTICAGNTTTLTASATGTTGTTTYTWTKPDASTATGATLSGALAAGIYTVVISNGTGCTASATSTVTLNAPTAYNVTGGGSYCAGGTGVAIGLDNSASGVNYQLYNGASAVGTAIAGTGAAISFGNQTAAGTYTVVATNTVGFCTAAMTGSAVVSSNALPTISSISATPSTICNGDTSLLKVVYPNDATVSTLAGSGIQGSTDNIIGTAASFYYPSSVAVDASGNVYVADIYNNKIRKITVAGVVSTLAGATDNSSGSADGTGANAKFDNPRGVAVDASGNVYVADANNNKIRKITAAGVVSTLAGSGLFGSADNTIGTSASFNYPIGVAVDASGNVYVGDVYNNKIRKITAAGVVTTLAGATDNSSGSADGTGTSASFKYPQGVAVDASGNVYVGDAGNNKIRKITAAGVVTTLAGATDNSSGSADGLGALASFWSPNNVAVDASGNVYVADYLNIKIRKITAAGVVTTLAGSDSLGSIAGVAVDASNNVYVADNHKIRKIVPVPAPTFSWAPAGNLLSASLDTTWAVPTATTVYTVTASNASGCTAISIVTVNVNTKPTAYNVTGGGVYCVGGIGVAIGLSGSESGVNYQLFKGASAVGTAVAGTGAAISFSSQTIIGTYTVLATNATTGCTAAMTGSAVISADASLPTLVAPSSFTINAVSNTCAANYTITDPITDNCTAATWGYSLSGATSGTVTGIADGSNSSPISFNKGTTTVTLSGVDANSNAATTVSFTVTVIDNQAPTIACSANITINNTPGFCTGKAVLTAPTVIDNCPNLGNALNFVNANNQYVSLPPSNNIPINNSHYTLEAYIKPNDLGFHGIIGYGNYGTNNQTNALRLDSLFGGRINNYWFGNDLYATPSSLPNPINLLDGNWHHIAATYDGTTRYIYVDGYLKASAPSSGMNVPNTNNFRIGSTCTNCGPSEIFDGSIDEVRIWKVARSQADIQANMNKELNAQPGLVAAYHFNNGVANATNTGITSAIDESGYGNHGTLTNFTLSGSTSNWTKGIVPSNYATLTNNAPLAFPNGVSTFPAGVNTITWTATDATGNVSTCNQTVTVVDNSLIAYNVTGGGAYCPGSAGVAIGLDNSIVGVNYQLYFGTTPVGTPIAGTGAAINFSNQTQIGFYTAKAINATSGCIATMNGSAEVSLDTSFPIITPPNNITLSTNLNTCIATYTILDPISDNCPGASWSYTLDGATIGTASGIADGSNSGTLAFSKGITEVNLSGIDATLNMAVTKKFFITVTDNQAPILTGPGTPSISNATGECAVTVTAPTATDACAGTITGTTTNPLTYTTQGTYTIIWTFDDGNGNSTTANQTVIVDDVTPPATPTIANATGECAVTVTAPTTTDNCAGTITGTTTDPLTYTTPGTFSITWTFDDGHGNTTTANQNVIVYSRDADLLGNGNEITIGDNTPSLADNSSMGILVGGAGSITKTFTIQNNGNAPLSISGITSDDGEFVISNFSPTTIAPTFTTTFDVTFTSLIFGVKDAIISINSNSCDEQLFTFKVDASFECPYPNYSFIGASQTNPSDPTIADNWLYGCIPSFSDSNINITIMSGQTFTPVGPIMGDIINNGTLKGNLNLMGKLTNNGILSPGN